MLEAEAVRLGIKGMRLDYSKHLGPCRYQQTHYKMRRFITRAQRENKPKLVNRWRMAL